jgi:DNA recombination protein RmuC
MTTTELLLVAVFVALLLLAIVVLVRGRKTAAAPSVTAAELALAVDDRLKTFQGSITDSMTATRKEVEASKAAVQASATDVHKALAGLSGTIQKLTSQQEGAGKLAEELKSVLQAPKLRGNFGEEALEAMLTKVLPPGIWKRQYIIEGREAVDAVVLFKDVIFPIDAKFPRDDYERYLEAETADTKRTAWKAFESSIKRQVDSIATKYVKPQRGTSDFALMFIPSEAIYYETIAHSNGLDDPNPLGEYCRERKVIPVSPNTFYAFLKVIVLAANNVQLLNDAKRLQTGLAEVKYSFEKFTERFEDVGGNLAKAAEAYGKGADHFDRVRERVDKVLALDFEEPTVKIAETQPVPAPRAKTPAR